MDDFKANALHDAFWKSEMAFQDVEDALRLLRDLAGRGLQVDAHGSHISARRLRMRFRAALQSVDLAKCTANSLRENIWFFDCPGALSKSLDYMVDAWDHAQAAHDQTLSVLNFGEDSPTFPLADRYWLTPEDLDLARFLTNDVLAKVFAATAAAKAANEVARSIDPEDLRSD